MCSSFRARCRCSHAALCVSRTTQIAPLPWLSYACAASSTKRSSGFTGLHPELLRFLGCWFEHRRPILSRNAHVTVFAGERRMFRRAPRARALRARARARRGARGAPRSRLELRHLAPRYRRDSLLSRFGEMSVEYAPPASRQSLTPSGREPVPSSWAQASMHPRPTDSNTGRCQASTRIGAQ